MSSRTRRFEFLAKMLAPVLAPARAGVLPQRSASALVANDKVNALDVEASGLPPGCVPLVTRTPDVEEAYEILQRSGVVILEDCFDADANLSEREIIDCAYAIPSAVFGSHLHVALPPTGKRLGVGSGRTRPGDLGIVPNSPHQDNSWGPLSMDFLLLLCDKPADEGGESYLVDGLALIDAMSNEDRDAWARVRFVPARYRPVEHGTVPVSWNAPALAVENGRRRLSVGTGGGYETHQWQEWPATDQPPEDQIIAARLITEYHDAMKRAEKFAPRFPIRRGQALLLDNKRFLHARDVFSGERRVWRVWWWSDRCTAEQCEFASREAANLRQVG
jgi:alpha-ketoglutarate-dependent taurine dioxygenase